MADDYTTEQLLDAIEAALTARDMRSVAMLVRRLAVQDPASAQAIVDALEIAKAAAR